MITKRIFALLVLGGFFGLMPFVSEATIDEMGEEIVDIVMEEKSEEVLEGEKNVEDSEEVEVVEKKPEIKRECGKAMLTRDNEHVYYFFKDVVDEKIFHLIKKYYKRGDALRKEERRAIYFSGNTASNQNGIRLINKWAEYGGNAIVFDIKDVDGYIHYDSKVPVSHEINAVRPKLGDLSEFIKLAKEKDMITIARVSMFKDSILAKKKRDWALKSIFTGHPWVNNKGLNWLDPSKREVQTYFLDLIEDVASLGVDEIQLDYVRFPTEGPVHAVKADFNQDLHDKYEVIVDFVKKAERVLFKYNVALSLDVFGVVAWNNGYDARTTGQKIECLAPYVDFIYPMIYPSHFSPGFGGIPDPPNQPKIIIKRSLDLFYPLVEGTRARIVPWLQAFPYRTKVWGTQYILDQVDASIVEGDNSYLWWSAGNSYEMLFRAMQKRIDSAQVQ